MVHIGKREFIQHTSKYLRLAANQEVVITHHDRPCLKLVPIHPKTIADLAGLVKEVKIVGDINEPILPGYKEWFS